jgi:Fe-S oxidoreductase
MFEEYIAEEIDTGTFNLPLRSPAPKVLLHGHCHQKAFNVVPAIRKTLDLLPETSIEMVETSCCGMAGSFGYGVETEEVSRRMGEISLFPAVRAESAEAIVVADGTSCRHQIHDGTSRDAIHVARLLELALDGSSPA